MTLARVLGLTLLIVLLALCIAPPLASGQTAGLSRLQNEDPNNWPMYPPHSAEALRRPRTGFGSCSNPSFCETTYSGRRFTSAWMRPI